jgi:hypothetical protein
VIKHLYLCILLLLLFALDGAAARAQSTTATIAAAAHATAAHVEKQVAQPTAIDIPVGTILPVRVDQEISLRKAKVGERLTGQIMQNVPLPGGGRIPQGTKIRGHIESVTPPTNSSAAQIALRWDQLKIGAQRVQINTDLRAVASYIAVLEAQTPNSTPDFGTPYNWATTTLVGGGAKYGVGGPVTDEESRDVGKGTWNGVLARLEPTPDCPDTSSDTDQLQALWVFSSDACDVYGIEGVQIARGTNGQAPASHASIVLEFVEPKARVRAGSGMLLQTIEAQSH